MTVNLNQQHADKQLSHPKYRPDIDGLRAIAVLSVVIFHAFPTWVKGGFVGVDIFFVISGFLISTIIFENLSKDSFSFFEFYSRRVKRIYPVLLVVLSVCFCLAGLPCLQMSLRYLGNILLLEQGLCLIWCYGARVDTLIMLQIQSLYYIYGP